MKLDLHYNLKQLHVNTLPYTNYFVPYHRKTEIRDNKKDLDKACVTPLNGDWNFDYYESVQEFEEAPHKKSKGRLPVPSVWNLFGYDQIQYVNIKYPIPFDPPNVPEENPCGFYQRHFDLHKLYKRKKRQYILNFDGVSSGYYVWINQQFVGYSQVSHSISRFDITDFIKEGKNSIAVLVVKYSDGTYFEDQDMFRHSGIFRNVYIVERPEQRIEDFKIDTKVDSDQNIGEINIDIRKTNGNPEIEYALFDPYQNKVARGELNKNLTIPLTEPKLWSAEIPNLYTLYLLTEDEIIEQKIGVREVKIEHQQLWINGQSVKLRGVNYHDSDPLQGYVVSEQRLITDLKLMKEANFNAIRTAHYPKSPRFYELADEYGFYVMSEADLETHGVVMLYGIENIEDFNIIADNSKYEKAILDRVEASIVQLQNYSSIIMWSLGNESGYGQNIKKAAALAHELDDTRPVHYEGAFYARGGEDYSKLDIISRMYPSPEEIESRYLDKKEVTKPFILCEYAHAMGNSPGGLEAYHELMEKYPAFIGAFVWEWCDHAVTAGMEEGFYRFRYGGDSGETLHDSNFCVDGIVNPERIPHEGFYEFQEIHRPLALKKYDGLRWTVRNQLDFLNVNQYLDVTLLLTTIDGESKKIPFELPEIMPHEEKELDFSAIVESYHFKFEELSSIMLTYRLKFRTALLTSDTYLGHDQVIYQRQVINKVEDQNASIEGEASIIIGSKSIYLRLKEWEYHFDKKTAALNLVKHKNKRLMDEPTKIAIWRAPTDNDIHLEESWKEMGYFNPITRVAGYNIDEQDNKIIISFDIGFYSVFSPKILSISYKWTIYPGGHIEIDMDMERNMRMPALPRFGMIWKLQTVYEKVRYYGNGPFSSYSDKNLACHLGWFDTTVDENFRPHIRPQEDGSHDNVTSLSIKSVDKEVRFSAGKPFSFNVKHYSDEQMTMIKHHDKLQKEPYSFVHIDAIQSGIGTNSCGPVLPERYQVNGPFYHLNYSVDFKEFI